MKYIWYILNYLEITKTVWNFQIGITPECSVGITLVTLILLTQLKTVSEFSKSRYFLVFENWRLVFIYLNLIEQYNKYNTVQMADLMRLREKRDRLVLHLKPMPIWPFGLFGIKKTWFGFEQIVSFPVNLKKKKVLESHRYKVWILKSANRST